MLTRNPHTDRARKSIETDRSPEVTPHAVIAPKPLQQRTQQPEHDALVAVEVEHEARQQTSPSVPAFTVEPSSVVEIIYASAATTKFSPTQLAALLADARKRNVAAGISGMLLYNDGSFIQVLEGDETPVDATINRIQKDSRHGRIILLSRREIEERGFASWSMGFVEVSQASSAALEGFSDFLRGGALGLARDAASISRVLAAFKDGRYRQSIH